MTKAERRKKARQKAKQRQRAEREQVGVSRVDAEVPQEAAPAPRSSASELITEPIRPRTTLAAAAQPAAPAQRRVEPAHTVIDAEGDDRDEDELDEEDWDDDDDDGPDDGEDDEPSEDDALLDATCEALKQGAEFSWAALIESLTSAAVEDPRLGLVLMLLVDNDNLPPLTGQQVLDAIEKMELPELITEAREHLEAEQAEQAEGAGKAAKVVQTTSRELREQSKNELASKARPQKASHLRERKTALASGVVPPGGDK
jgi:hypothetical protein